jgi:SAM-dependent methyltransferase
MSTLAELHPQPQTGLDSVPQTPSCTTGTTATTATTATCSITQAQASFSSSSAPTNENENENEKTAALEAANVAFFDALGHDFDKRHPEAADGADRLARALRRVLALDEGTTSVLDYACGSGTTTHHLRTLPNALTNSSIIIIITGQVSRALAPYVAQLVGVDISPRMVEVYNARANAQGLEPHEMRAVGSLAELDQQQQQQRFDVAVVRTRARAPLSSHSHHLF